jgi:hypothetical protein
MNDRMGMVARGPLYPGERRNRCVALTDPLGREETFGKSRNSRDQDQFLAIGRRRPAEIAILSLYCQAAKPE